MSFDGEEQVPGVKLMYGKPEHTGYSRKIARGRYGLFRGFTRPRRITNRREGRTFRPVKDMDCTGSALCKGVARQRMRLIGHSSSPGLLHFRCVRCGTMARYVCP